MTADPRAAVLAALDTSDVQARAVIEKMWTSRVQELSDGSWMQQKSPFYSVHGADPARNIVITDSLETSFYVAAHDPATVLAHNEALRFIVGEHSESVMKGYCASCPSPYPCKTLRTLADGYASGWRDA